MEIYELKTMQRCEIEGECVVALGTFDGCHVGHRKILNEAFYEAKRKGVKSLIYTFSTLPKSSFGQVCALMTLEEKLNAFKKTNIDYVAVDNFENVRMLEGEEFVSRILLSQLRCASAVCGYNYRFGKGARWGAEALSKMLKKSGGSVVICPKVQVGDNTVSSTLIRSFVESGRMENVVECMGPYSVFSMVEHGKGLGKKMGFATINQKIPSVKAIPKKGVYVTECEIGEDVYPAVTNVGTRPTTDGDGAELNMETHIIGYETDLYYSYIRVNFYKMLREEKRFDSVEELNAQIEKDKKEAIAYFK